MEKIGLNEVLQNSSGLEPWQIIIYIMVGAVIAYFASYLKEKGKFHASKEDIEEITKKVGQIEHKLEETNRIKNKKYELKYQACLDVLCILDAQMSQVMLTNQDEEIPEEDRQPLKIQTMRECHNRLILSVDNQDIIKLFMSMMLNQSTDNMKDLDKIRILIRKELEFGSDILTDGENTWFVKLGKNKIT